MEKETGDEVRGLLERATTIIIEDIEAGNMLRIGRDSKAREGFINYIAQVTHENLAKEIRRQIGSFLYTATERINKL